MSKRSQQLRGFVNKLYMTCCNKAWPPFHLIDANLPENKATNENKARNLTKPSVTNCLPAGSSKQLFTDDEFQREYGTNETVNHR
jgi:hypothetical protein